MNKVSFIISILLSASAAALGQGRSISLAECKELSYKNNTELKNKHLDYLSAKMKKEEVMTGWFPVISARAIGFHALNPMIQLGLKDVLGSSDMAGNIRYYLQTQGELWGVNTRYEDLRYGYGAMMTLAQPIFAGGRIATGNRLASLGVKASSLQEQITKRDLGAQIGQKYRLVLSLEQKKEVLQEAMDLSDRLIGKLEEATGAGLDNDDVLKDLQLKRLELRSAQVKLKGSILLAKMDLCNAVGLSSAEAKDLVLSDDALSCSEPAAYYRDPAEIVSGMAEQELLELGVKQQKLQKSMVLGEALPQIGLGASYGYTKTIGDPLANGLVFASVNIPITDWKKTSSKLKSTGYQMQKAENDREHLKNMLQLQLRQLWVEIESAWEEISVKEENLALSLRREERARDDYQAGLATSDDYMQKQLDSSKAECELIDARIAYCNAVAAYTSKFTLE